MPNQSDFLPLTRADMEKIGKNLLANELIETVAIFVMAFAMVLLALI